VAEEQAGEPKRGLSQKQKDSMAAEYRNGMSLESLSGKYVKSKTRVRDILREQGVTLRRKGRTKKHPDLTASTVRELTKEAGSQRKAARKLGVDHMTFNRRTHQ